MYQAALDLGVTFRDNKNQAVHSWYPYVEGFSADYVRQKVSRRHVRPEKIYDPFGGSGTVQLVASWAQIPSYYSEVNPFMAFVAEAKVTSAREAKANYADFREATNQFLGALYSDDFLRRAKQVDLSHYHEAFPKRDFFVEEHICEIIAAKELALEIAGSRPWLSSLLLLAIASNAVASSNMTRRADLRRRRSDEYLTRIVNVRKYVIDTLTQMVRDLAIMPEETAPMTKLADDCRELAGSQCADIDLAITSPPYLNGTNYFRNTKIELWLLDFIKSEKDLPSLCQKAITAGINNVSKSRSIEHNYAAVEEVAAKLDTVAPDKRIPALVRQYFSDMTEVFRAVRDLLKPGGEFVFDIGDSKFYGVHVPTDRLLIDAARAVGFDVVSDEVIARRYSRDRSQLLQVEIVFRKA